MFTNDEVLDRFLNKESAKSNNLTSDGVILKSYEMIIAQWFTDGTLRVHLSHCPSVTTTQHRNKLIRRCETTHPNTYQDFPKKESYLITDSCKSDTHSCNLCKDATT